MTSCAMFRMPYRYYYRIRCRSRCRMRCHIRCNARNLFLRPCGSVHGIATTLQGCGSLASRLRNTIPPHLLGIFHRDLSGERPPIAPHPDVDLEQATACSADIPGICSCALWNFMPQCVRNCVVLVPHHVARRQRNTAKNIFHRADIESWEL